MIQRKLYKFCCTVFFHHHRKWCRSHVEENRSWKVDHRNFLYNFYLNCFDLFFNSDEFRHHCFYKFARLTPLPLNDLSHQCILNCKKKEARYFRANCRGKQIWAITKYDKLSKMSTSWKSVFLEWLKYCFWLDMQLLCDTFCSYFVLAACADCLQQIIMKN